MWQTKSYVLYKARVWEEELTLQACINWDTTRCKMTESKKRTNKCCATSSKMHLVLKSLWCIRIPAGQMYSKVMTLKTNVRHCKQICWHRRLPELIASGTSTDVNDSVVSFCGISSLTSLRNRPVVWRRRCEHLSLPELIAEGIWATLRTF